MSSSYDFVIIGGGTAGLVVATRLSEVSHFRVLVLEAGKDISGDLRVKAPALYTTLLGTEADWGFQTEPQAGLGGRCASVNQGRALGGSSAINAQVFVPPAKDLIDAWGLLGNEGWNWDTFQKYIRKSYSSPSVDNDTEKALGIDGWTTGDVPAKGPILTSYPPNPSASIQQVWSATFKSKGLHMTKDPFVEASVGSFSHLNSVDPSTRERSYVTTAYYYPVKDRQNLVVITGAVVEKILFDQQSSRGIEAKTVRYRHHSEIQTITATKEVILAAGAFQSPKILELSGIGNSKLLEKHGIEVIKDLPGVGENLQDHLVCGISYRAVDSLDTLDALARQEPEAVGLAMQDYVTNRSGPLTSTGIEAYAYLPVIDHSNGPGQKRLHDLIRENRPSEADHAAQAIYSLASKTLLDSAASSAAYLALRAQAVLPVDLSWSPNSPTGPIPGKFITIAVLLSNPLSRGSVHIRSADPTAAPLIDPAYLSHPLDTEILAEHMLQIEKIAVSEPLSSKFLAQPLQRRDPATDLKGDLDHAKKYVKASSNSMWHPGGACAMLPLEAGGVVDSALRVYGVQGLRVVDASMMPLVTTANLQATVYGVAERAAEMIKHEWLSS
ncbi:hypothetical protein J7T55_001903 [Diaporthe amygdali]|uniref:uncharacterized protein n=1 Tax=Phomopsis amygdali TaxID=1214568 RepID=UPI0022FF06A4|nr:uncharacterized protein J7T55_001903 [Diaporthe amygdali]KAJ0117704.1 hypothetical protein J7T55_001903 [Diaporthe amygdali]